MKPHVSLVGVQLGCDAIQRRFSLFTNDDCKPSPNWLKKIATRLAEDPEQMISGRVLNGIPENIFNMSSQLTRDPPHVYSNENDCPVESLGTDKLGRTYEMLSALRGFDKSLRVETASVLEFYQRWLKCGYKITYAPQAIVECIHAPSLHHFVRGQFQQGRDTFYFHSVRDQKRWKALEVDLKFYLRLFYYCLFRVHGRRTFVLAA